MKKTYLFLLLLFISLVGVLIYLGGQPSAEEAGNGASNWEAYIALMQSVPHWAFEITLEIITGILIYPLAKWFWTRAVTRHDEEFHPDDVHGKK
jgi:ABC-type antimicrobial peptide transport system permease subunit